MKIFCLLLTCSFLTACQSTIIETEGRYLEVSRQASIEITQDLEVAPDSARVFLQNGAVIVVGQLNLYDVNCEIEINTVSEKTQIIAAGVFNIISIAQEESAIVKTKVKTKVNKSQVMIASLDYTWVSDSPVDIKRYYNFRLSAQNQNLDSQVRAVICRGAQAEPYNAELPSYEQMKVASGKYLKFNF